MTAKFIKLANQKAHQKPSEPIKSQTECLQPTQSAGTIVWLSRDYFLSGISNWMRRERELKWADQIWRPQPETSLTGEKMSVSHIKGAFSDFERIVCILRLFGTYRIHYSVFNKLEC